MPSRELHEAALSRCIRADFARSHRLCTIYMHRRSCRDCIVSCVLINNGKTELSPQRKTYKKR